jgi:hypothetical protein
VDSPSQLRDERVPHTSGGGVLPLSVERPPSLARRFSPLGSFYFSLASVLRQGWLCLGAISSPATSWSRAALLLLKGTWHMASLGVAAVDPRSNVLRSLFRRCRVSVIDAAIESLLLSECHGINVGVISEAEERLTHNGRDARYPGMNHARR